MGYGPVINGKQRPISSWDRSWAKQEQDRREGKPVPPLPKPTQWPIGWKAAK